MMEVSSLVARARGGDPDAIGLLLRQTEPDLRRFAARLCRTESDADDAVQHAMLTMTVKLDSFQGLARLSTWIFKVIQNECRRVERQARRWLFHTPETLESEALSPEAALETQRMADRVVRAIRELPPDLREIFVLRELEGLDTEACATRLGITSNNAKVRLSRARSALRQLIATD